MTCRKPNALHLVVPFNAVVNAYMKIGQPKGKHLEVLVIILDNMSALLKPDLISWTSLAHVRTLSNILDTILFWLHGACSKDAIINGKQAGSSHFMTHGNNHECGATCIWITPCKRPSTFFDCQVVTTVTTATSAAIEKKQHNIKKTSLGIPCRLFHGHHVCVGVQ